MSNHPMEDGAAWVRRLLRAWIILTALTVVSVTSALAGTGSGHRGAGAAAAAVALVTAFIKARQVLDHFLDLHQSTPSWRGFFSTMLAAILLGCLAPYLWTAWRS